MFETLPTDRSTRWKLVRELAARFHSKPKHYPNIDGNTLTQYEKSLGQSLPAAVREWYLHIGEIGDFWTGQDSMWIPDVPIIDGALVPLMVENQNCFRMGYLVDDGGNVDPKVHRYSDGEPEFQLSPTVTEFAIQMLILETIWSGTYSYFDCADGITGVQAKAVESEFRQCAISNMYLWSAPIRFLIDDDVVFRLDYDGDTEDYAFLGFAAATQDAFNKTKLRLFSLGVELVT